MLVHIIADNRHVIILQGGSLVGWVGPIPYDGNSRGNPYLVFGPIIREYLKIEPTEASVTVSRVTSGDLDKWVSQ